MAQLVGPRIHDLPSNDSPAVTDAVEISRKGSTGSFFSTVTQIIAGALGLFNPLDDAAVGDGIVDDRAAIAAAATRAGALKGILLSAGTYRVASNLTIAVPIKFADGAVLKPDSGVTVTITAPVRATSSAIINRSAGGALVFSGTAPHRVPAEWFGAKPDGVTNSATAIKAAIDAVTPMGGTVVFRPGNYLFGTTGITLDGTRNVTLLGASSGGYGHSQLNTTVGTTFAWTGGAGSGSMITVTHAWGCQFREIGFYATVAAYNGDLVNFSSPDSDISFIRFERCAFVNMQDANTPGAANSLLRVNRAIVWTIKDCMFLGGKYGARFGDTIYNVSFLIEGCTTVQQSTGGCGFVLGAIENFTIDEHTFESNYDGTAAAVQCLPSVSALGLTIRNCWSGDANATLPGTWYSIKNAYGFVFDNNRSSTPGRAIDPHLVIDGCQGVRISGSRFQDGVGIHYAGAVSYGITVLGNDFGTSTSEVVDIGRINYVAWGNNGLPNVVGSNNDQTINTGWASSNPQYKLDFQADFARFGSSSAILFGGTALGDWSGKLYQVATGFWRWAKSAAGAVLELQNTQSTQLSGVDFVDETGLHTGYVGYDNNLNKVILGSRATSGGGTGDQISDVSVYMGTQEMMRVPKTALSADQVGLLVVRNSSGTLTVQQVTQGAADSAGSGFRALRIPN